MKPEASLLAFLLMLEQRHGIKAVAGWLMSALGRDRCETALEHIRTEAEQSEGIQRAVYEITQFHDAERALGALDPLN